MRSFPDGPAPDTKHAPAAFSPLIAPQGLWPIDKLFITYIAVSGLLLALAPYIVSRLGLSSQDLTLARWDLALWKTDPVFLPDVLQNPLLTEVLQLVYFLFIPSVIGLGILYWYQRSSPEFRYCTFLVVMTFLITYLGYVVVPARGPRFMDYVSHHPALQGLWFFHFFQGTLDNLEGLQYDCFPSGHVAVTIICAYAARKLSSTAFWIYCVFAALIAFSTIYLRYHYMIDVLAGALLAVLLIVFSPALYRTLDHSVPG